MRIIFLLLAISLTIGLTVVSACSVTEQTSTTEEVTASPESPVRLELSTELNRNCAPFSASAPKSGELAIDFTLKDIHGTEFTLSELLAEKPVVMVFGSYT
jgi:cytochrome oxidase Cu insertion factor (SCO1/SenC/PrrC family)